MKIIPGRCENIKGAAIEALAVCMHLEKLDLSGCKLLTDDMMLPFSRGDTIPSLKTLSLVNAILITDATIQWISSNTNSLQHLSLRGTLIKRSVLMGVRDHFPNSDLVIIILPYDYIIYVYSFTCVLGIDLYFFNFFIIFSFFCF